MTEKDKIIQCLQDEYNRCNEIRGYDVSEFLPNHKADDLHNIVYSLEAEGLIDFLGGPSLLPKIQLTAKGLKYKVKE